LTERLQIPAEDLTKPDFMALQQDRHEGAQVFNNGACAIHVRIIKTIFNTDVTLLELAKLAVGESLQSVKAVNLQVVRTIRSLQQVKLKSGQLLKYEQGNQHSEEENSIEHDEEVEAGLMAGELHSPKFHNSSSSQPTNISKAVENTLQVVKQRILLCIRLLKLSFLSTVRPRQSLIFSITSIVVSSLIHSLTNDINTSMGKSHNFGELMWNIENLAYRSKQLLLLNKGLDFGLNEAGIKSDMSLNLDFLENSILKYGTEFDRVYIYRDNNRLRWWDFEDNRFIEEHMNFVTMLSRVQMAASSIISSDITKLTEHHSGFMSLHRNAPNELITYFNETIRELVKTSKDEVSKIYDLVFMMTFLNGGVFLLLIGSLIIPVLLYINHLRKQLWLMLFKLPQSVSSLGKSHAMERLLMVHGSFDQEKEVSEIHFKRRAQYKIHSLQWLIYGSLVVVLVGVAGFLYAVCSLFQGEMYWLLSTKTEYYYYADLRKAMAQSTLFWQREFAFPEPQFADYNPLYSPYEEFNRASIDMITAEMKLRTDFGTVSTQHFDYINRNACTADLCYPFIAKGLHSAIFGIRILERYFIADLKIGMDYFEAGGLSIEFLVQKSIDAIKQGVVLYSDETQRLLDTHNTWIESTTWTVIVGLFVFYFFFTRVMINALHEVIELELGVPVVLPKEHLEEVRNLLISWRPK
jgi:hypothetical protein